MSAPSNSYHNNGNTKLPISKGSQENTLVAIYTADYNTNSLVKNTFYLDVIFRPEKKVSGALQGTFIGGVIVGGANEIMHNPARFSKQRLGKTTGTVVKICNDAGLNTLGITVGKPVPSSKVFTNVQIPITYKSAFYVNTDISGWQFRIWNSTTNNWEGWSDGGNLGTALQNTQYSFTASVVFSDVSTDLKTHGFQVRPYITNVEGTYYGQISDAIFVTGLLTEVKEGDWNTGTPNTFYRDKLDILGAEDGRDPGITRFYTDDTLNSLFQPNGIFTYWRDASNWLTYGLSQIAGEYCVIRTGTASGSGSPSSPLTYDYNGYNQNSQTAAEDEVLNNTGSHVGTLYLDENESKAWLTYSGSYPAWVFSNKANQGYYAHGNIANVESVLYVDANGVYEYVYIN